MLKENKCASIKKEIVLLTNDKDNEMEIFTSLCGITNFIKGDTWTLNAESQIEK